MMIPDHLVTCGQLDIYQVSGRETLLKYFFWVSLLEVHYWGVYCIVEPDEVLLKHLLEDCLVVYWGVC